MCRLWRDLVIQEGQFHDEQARSKSVLASLCCDEFWARITSECQLTGLYLLRDVLSKENKIHQSPSDHSARVSA